MSKRVGYTTRRRKGAALVLVCILLGLVCIAVAFSVDVARIQLTQLELQSAADAAARAGAEAMARGVGHPSSSSIMDANVRAEIEMVAALNYAGGDAVDLSLSNDIEFGRTSSGSGGTTFNANTDGSFDMQTDSVRVKSEIATFPLVFGAFVGRDNVVTQQSGAAMIEQRDIVLVLDKSTSMLRLDAGSYPVADYNDNLYQLQDDLFGENDHFYPADDDDDDSSGGSHTEFVTDSSSTFMLSRTQALKLAVLRFRQEIDRSHCREKLGMVSYAKFANVPENAPLAPGPVNILSGLSSHIYDSIVGDGETKSSPSSPYDQHPDERNASALEDESNGYANFDYNYLRMRWAERTNIADGIDKGVQVLFGPGRRSHATPILIVMTDGVHNESGTPEDSATAAIAAHPNLKIYTITFGAGANQSSMQSVANIGRGQHFHAGSVDDLIAAYVQIAKAAGVTLVE